MKKGSNMELFWALDWNDVSIKCLQGKFLCISYFLMANQTEKENVNKMAILIYQNKKKKVILSGL
jgi:hypothetical protein